MMIEQERESLKKLIENILRFQSELAALRVRGSLLLEEMERLVKVEEKEKIDLARVFKTEERMRYSQLVERIMEVKGIGFTKARRMVKGLLDRGQIVRIGKVNTKNAQYGRG